MKIKTLKEVQSHGPKIYKSELGLFAYKNEKNEELYIAHLPIKLDHIKQDVLLQEDDNSYFFEGYASTWTLDLGDDIIRPGAFLDSLKVRKPKVLAFHDPDLLAGFSMEEMEDEIGLRVKGRIPKDGANTPSIVPYMGEGGIDSLSIGFRIARDDDGELMMDFINGVRIIKKIELFEYSFVTFPMNPAAKVQLGTSIPEQIIDGDVEDYIIGGDEEEMVVDGKGTPLQIGTIRDVEKVLIQNFKFSGKAAKLFISNFKKISNTRDDEDAPTVDDNGLTAEDYKSLITNLEGEVKKDEELGLSEKDAADLLSRLTINTTGD